MAIATAAQLETAIGNWLARSDLSSRIPEFIALAEADMRRELNALDQETKTTSFSITGEYVAVPSDMQMVRSMYSTVSGDRYGLEYMPEAHMNKRFGITPDTPLYYCIVGSNFRFAPIPNATYTATLIYTITFTALASGSDHNWILDKFPDLYLWGALVHAMQHIQDDVRVAQFTQLYSAARDGVNRRNARNRWSGPGLATTPG